MCRAFPYSGHIALDQYRNKVIDKIVSAFYIRPLSNTTSKEKDDRIVSAFYIRLLPNTASKDIEPLRIYFENGCSFLVLFYPGGFTHMCPPNIFTSRRDHDFNQTHLGTLLK